MAKEAMHIPFDEFRDRLPVIFDAVAKERKAVLVERDGVLYRLEPQAPATLQTADPHNIWAGYDPAKVKAAFHRGAGLLTGVDTKELLKDIYEQREQDSTGRPAE